MTGGGTVTSLDIDGQYRDTVEDNYDRRAADEYDLHLRASEERRFDEVSPDWKPPARVKRSNAPRPDRLWKERVLERDQGCCVHVNPKDCREGWQAHHVVPQQELRRTFPEALWNPLAGIGVCGLAHRQHHNRTHPITLDMIPLPVQDYLGGIGYRVFLERHYAA